MTRVTLVSEAELQASSVPRTVVVMGTPFRMAFSTINDALGALRCWGLNDSGQLGDNTLIHKAAPSVVTGLDNPRQLVLAQQYRRKRVDPISPPQASREIPRVPKIDRETLTAKILGELERRGFPHLTDRHQRYRARRWGWFVDQHCQPFDPSGPADTRQRWPAHHLDQPVISAAGHHGSLRSKIGGDEFKGGVGVVVEPAHEPRV